MERGRFGQILRNCLDTETRKAINTLVTLASMSDHTDEHGSWDFGCEFDRRGRGEALNWDLYAFGYDLHSGQLLAVVQIRKFERRRKYPRIRKNYFLIGYNEDNTVFAHPVESRVIHSAIKSDRDVIAAIQRWMFGTDYSHVTRQGDVALIPQRPRTKNTISVHAATIERSHILRADEIRSDGESVWAKNPSLTHPTHPPVSAAGWHKIVISQRAAYWKFAAPTAD